MTHGNERVPALLVSGTHSGAGKTTATAAMIRGLRKAGLRVQPFKLGPDFIDGAYLAEAAGRPAVNLDLWMMGTDGVRNSLRRWSNKADIAVIEAVGALYDGADGGERGSAAEMAKLLGIPVVLVLDVWGMTRTASAVIRGMREFDPAVRIGACVLNRVGSDAHREMVEAAMTTELRQLLVGAINHDDSLLIPERHLGLLTAAENRDDTKLREVAQLRAANGLDLSRLAALAEAGGQPSAHALGEVSSVMVSSPRARLAIARDAAFCFYYEDNLRLLAEAGFELVPFRPTSDPGLPEGIDAVYIGGGYPESFATELAANTTLSAELRRRSTEGLPIYAECGGLLYLGRSLTGFDGERHPMSAVLDLDTIMDPTHLAISYVEARTQVGSPLGDAGTVVRGQEFHQSRIVRSRLQPNLFGLTTSRGEERRDGFLRRNVAASYVHLHFASCPVAARNFVACAVAAK
jgi:cobyrinic acid a,c-diamide synthase